MPQSGVTIETVQVVKPIKILALVCGIIAVLLLIICVASNSWVEARDYKQGLWKVCTTDAENTENCGSPDDVSGPWLLASGVFIIITLLVSVVVVILTAIGLCSKEHTKKFKMYRVATFTMFAGFVLSLVPLILYPIMFMQDLNQRSIETQITEWYFAWSYGLAWGGAVFQLGCAILLFIDKEDDIYYKEEKTTYHN